MNTILTPDQLKKARKLDLHYYATGAAECRAAGFEPQYTGSGRWTRSRSVPYMPSALLPALEGRLEYLPFGLDPRARAQWLAGTRPGRVNAALQAAAELDKIKGAELEARMFRRFAEAEAAGEDGSNLLRNRHGEPWRGRYTPAVEALDALR